MPADQPGRDMRFCLMNWIAIVNQLSVTRANRQLDAGPLPFAQFVMLLHFSAQADRQHSVTEVANAFQQPQPGTTKTIRKLEEKGFLHGQAHPTDGRVKLFSITPGGQQAVSRAADELMPLLTWLFDGWDDAGLARMYQDLDRLKVRLDTNRG